jgi:hypothetical protein
MSDDKKKLIEVSFYSRKGHEYLWNHSHNLEKDVGIWRQKKKKTCSTKLLSQCIVFQQILTGETLKKLKTTSRQRKTARESGSFKERVDYEAKQILQTMATDAACLLTS